MQSKIFKGVASAATAAILITGCSSTAVPESTATPSASQTQEPVETETPEPTATARPAPEVPEFSQMVGGVLYEGTERFPVRIGEDVIGAPPALEAEQLNVAGIFPKLRQENKYLVSVMMSADKKGKFFWSIEAPSSTKLARSFEELGEGGYYTSAEDAANAAKGFKVEGGRVLDRSEYVFVVQEKYAVADYSYPDQN